MKIKLVTFAPHPNFGTCLQSYALNKVLRDMGHEVEFIYNGRETPPKNVAYFFKALAKSVLPKQIVKRIKDKRAEKRLTKPDAPPYIFKLPNNYIRYWLSLLPGYKRIYKLLKCRSLQWKKVFSFTFEDGNYRMKRLYIKKQYDEVVKDADLFITGSDQIWNPYCGGFNPMMFLEFAGNKKRVAYSSSIARPCFPKDVEQRAKEDLSKFQHIAVREQSSVNMLNKLLGRDDVQLVVDPTYLLSTEEWEKFGNRAIIEFELPKKYIFCYFVGERFDDYTAMVDDVKTKTGINDVITIDCTGCDINYGNGILYKCGGPYEWVYLLSHAALICMDSFHATIFALKFKKEFVHMLKNRDDQEISSQNTRMYDLFERYGLLYKIYDNHPNEWMKCIDYQKVSCIMDKEIRESFEFLKYEIAN
jgi:hypothetical protein